MIEYAVRYTGKPAMAESRILDYDGVDNSCLPRFKCLNCKNNMIPIYYKSIHGYIHEYKEN